MDNYFKVIINFILIILFLWINTFLHELGHAIFGLLFTRNKVELRIGNPKDKIRISMGRLNIFLNGLNPYYGSVQCYDIGIFKIKRIIFFLGGPIVSLIVFSVLLYFIRYKVDIGISRFVLKFNSIYSISTTLVTIIPIKYNSLFGPYNGMESDGFQILKIISNK